MSPYLGTLPELLGALTDPEPMVFGVRFITDTVHGSVSDDIDLGLETEGMFSLTPGRVTLRARVNAKVDLFRELWADVALQYNAPEEYAIDTPVFLEFANDVVMPQLRNQIQAMWNPLLVDSGYPPNILPPAAEIFRDVFRGEHLPAMLMPATMVDLRSEEQLAVPDPPDIDGEDAPNTD